MDDTQRMREALAQAAIDGTLDDLLYPYIQRFPHPDTDMPSRGIMMAPDVALDAPILDDLSRLPVFQGVPLFYTHMALLRSAIDFDGAGNMFYVAGFQDGNWTTAYLRKTSWDGRTLLLEGTVPLSHNWKQDGLACRVTGADLVIAPLGHDTPNPVPADGRLSVATATRIVGICQPYRDTAQQGGGASEPLPQVQEAEVDYDLIITKFVTALNTKDSPLQVAMSKLVKNNAKIADGEALNDSYATVNGSFYKGDGPYQRFKDTVWEQVHKVMRERGVGTDPPPPPPEPEP